MKRLTCSKCKWFMHHPPKEEDTPDCFNCGHPYNYKTDITEDNIESLPVDWSKVKD